MDIAGTPFTLCSSGEIPDGSSRGFDPEQNGQDTIFIVRIKGQLYGWRNACPHINGAPMAWRKDAYLNAKGTHIACHAHGALFEPETGVCVQGPCMGKALQAVQISESENGQVMLNPFSINNKSEEKQCQQ